MFDFGTVGRERGNEPRRWSPKKETSSWLVFHPPLNVEGMNPGIGPNLRIQDFQARKIDQTQKIPEMSGMLGMQPAGHKKGMQEKREPSQLAAHSKSIEAMVDAICLHKMHLAR